MKRWKEGVKLNDFQGSFAVEWNRGAFDPKAARSMGPRLSPGRNALPGGTRDEASGSVARRLNDYVPNVPLLNDLLETKSSWTQSTSKGKPTQVTWSNSGMT